MKTQFLLILGALLLGVAPLKAQQANPLIGTWKINMAKSKFLPGQTPPSNSVNVFTAFGKNGISNVRQGSNKANYSLNFDGRDYSYTGVSDRDAVSGREVNPRLFRLVFKGKGEANQINYLSVSDDGTTLTIFSMITPGNNYVDQRAIVYDRQ